MKFIAITAFALCAATVFFTRMAAAEELTVTIYLVAEEYVCPGGYAQSKCPRLTGTKVDELRSKKLLQRFGPTRTITVDRDQSQPFSVPLGRELGLARRYRASGSKTAALVVVEWRKPELPMAYQAEGADDELFTGAIENRRAFSHARARNLDPEERYLWTFSRGGKSFLLVFE